MTDPNTFTGEKINRLVLIKTVGWTMLIVAGFATYTLAWDIALVTVISNPARDFMESSMLDSKEQWSQAFDNMKHLLFVSFAVIALLFTCAIGMLNLKKWALIFFHAVSLTTLIVVFGLVIYTAIDASAVDSGPNDITFAEHFQYVVRLNMIQYGILAVIIAWILSRVNILLFRHEYRKEFN